MIDYSKHPAFDFNKAPFILSDELLISFEQAYRLAETKGSRMSDNFKLELRVKCNDLLKKIKITLLQQDCSDRETYFIDDLFSKMTPLLSADLDFYFKDTKVKADSHLNAESFDKLLKLNSELFFTSKVSQSIVDDILKVSKPLLNSFRENAKNNLTTRENLSANSGVTVKKVVGILNSEFEKSGINEIVSLYMGQSMCVGGLAIELSVPTANWWRVAYEELSRPAKTSYFHFDESLAVPKAIVYLCDVTIENGPTSVAEYDLGSSNITALQYLVGRIIGSVARGEDSSFKNEYNHLYHQTFGSKLFRQDFMRLPKEMRWNSHYGWDVIPDSDLEETLINTESKVLGDAGTFIVFDGAKLLHRGGLLSKGERIALQVVFAPKMSITKRVIAKLGRIINKITG